MMLVWSKEVLLETGKGADSRDSEEREKQDVMNDLERGMSKTGN